VGVVDSIRETWFRATGRTQLAEELRQERAQSDFLEESIADLETRMYSSQWQLLTAQGDMEFTREGLRQITAVSRVLAQKNPLIKRGLGIRQAYVWGQGVSITGRDGDVNGVVQDFLADPGNRRALTSAQAQQTLERALGTDGNVLFALFTAPLAGKVQARVLPWDQVGDVITNPEDSTESWYYRRDWWEERRDPVTGGIITERRIVFYPALGYNPSPRPSMTRSMIDGQSGPIQWDAPVVHVKVNALLGWKWGVGDAYAAIDWAQAYKDFLTDWAVLIKALSRFAWRLTSKGSKQAQSKAKISAAPTTDTYTQEPRRAGATALLTPEMALEAIPKSGATIDSESGRPLAAMVAAALDVPVTMLLGDPGTTGARATAETLDTPTERAMQQRQGLWGDVLHQILSHVIASAVKAPKGPLSGRVERDETGRETVVLAGAADPTVDIAWPDLDDIDVATAVKAIVDADSTTRIPPEIVARLLLEALGVKDVDGILDKLTDDQGRWLGPEPSPGATAMQAVLDWGQVPPPALPGGLPALPAGPEPPPAGQEPASPEDGNQEETPAPPGEGTAPAAPGQRSQPQRTTRAQRRRR
jgi:hypothetical protein